jgi:hypothetical protein
MAWFGLKKRKYEYMEDLERIKFHVEETERIIKRINKDKNNLAHYRMRDPKWDRKSGYPGHYEKEFISDSEAMEWHIQIVQAQRDFAKKVMPLVEQLRDSK